MTYYIVSTSYTGMPYSKHKTYTAALCMQRKLKLTYPKMRYKIYHVSIHEAVFE